VFERPPAPLIIFSTFVGYLAGGPTGGPLMRSASLCLPSRSRSSCTATYRPHRRRHPRDGGTSVVDIPTAVIALGAFLILNRHASQQGRVARGQSSATG
jgi:hypothetical protein